MEENQVKRSYEVIYMEDGSVTVKSTGPVEMSDGEIYNDVKLLADMVRTQEIKEACKEGAYIGTQIMFAEIAKLKAQQSAPEVGPTLE